MTTLYGFHTLEDIFEEPASENIRQVTDAVRIATDAYNRMVADWISLLSFTTTEYGIGVQTGGYGRRLQPLDEVGRAVPTRGPVMAAERLNFPLQKAGDAIAQTYDASLEFTVEQVNNNLEEMQHADREWIRTHLLAALFSNTAWTYQDPTYGPLEIYGLANGDAHTYFLNAGTLVREQDTHYLTQTQLAIDELDNPFPILRQEIIEHPINQGGQIVAFIHPDQRSGVEGLEDFFAYPDPNIRPSPLTEQLVGSPGTNLPGNLIGYVDGVFVLEWGALPSGYVIATSTAAQRPLAFRQPALAALQGFRQDGERNDYPYLMRQFVRRGGFGAYNRVAAAIMRLGNATYAPPADLAAPLP